MKAPPGRSIDAPHESNGMKALHYAAVNGHDDIVAFLLNHGSRCDEIDSLGETALSTASKNGQAAVAKILLDGGADPVIRGGEWLDIEVLGLYGPWSLPTIYKKPTSKLMAIHHAAFNGHDNVLHILPYTDSSCGDREANALHLGAGCGHAKVVEALLSKGAEIESGDLDGMRALHYASRNGHSIVAQILLDKGSKINSRSSKGYTALHCAAQAGKIDTIRLLVASGAAVAQKALSDDDTALHMAARYADADTLRALVECGAPLENKNSVSQTALVLAVQNNAPANVLALIELGALWIRSDTFFHALLAKNTDTVEVLLSRLSIATATEQQEAKLLINEAIDRSVGGIERIRINKQARQMLENWLRKRAADGRIQELRKKSKRWALSPGLNLLAVVGIGPRTLREKNLSPVTFKVRTGT